MGRPHGSRSRREHCRVSGFEGRTSEGERVSPLPLLIALVLLIPVLIWLVRREERSARQRALRRELGRNPEEGENAKRGD